MAMAKCQDAEKKEPIVSPQAPRPERLIIRPPSEWRSMLIRSTRGCRWNRCKFCGIYPAMGEPLFSIRPVEEVKRDIEWFSQRMPALATAFLGDADPLCREIHESVEILSCLRRQNSQLRRITAYGRAATLRKLGEEGLRQLAEAGLNRIHLGLESGDPATLKFHCKGQTPAIVEEACTQIKKAGLDLSVYVLLGLGGKAGWEQHIERTAELLQKIQPHHIRIRRLWIYQADENGLNANSPLVADIRAGRFQPQTAEGTVYELQRLIQKLEGCRSQLICDHNNNYVKVSGSLETGRQAMLGQIEAFLSLPPQERDLYLTSTESVI